MGALTPSPSTDSQLLASDGEFTVRVTARSVNVGTRSEIRYTVRGFHILDRNYFVERTDLLNVLAPPNLICDAAEIGDPGKLFYTSDLPEARRWQLWLPPNIKSEEC